MLERMRLLLRTFAVLLAVVGLILGSSSANPALAVPGKTVSFDCNNPGTYGGDVYLKPGESLRVNFANCDADIYIDVDTSPNTFTTVITRPTSDGFVTFFSDGTYVISATVPQGSDAQGIWHSPNASEAYMWLDSNNQNINNYVGVRLAGEDASTISGSQSQRVAFEFPSQLSPADFFLGVPELEQCISYDPSNPFDIDGDPIPYKSTDFVVTAGGNVTIRTESTSPTSSFTAYLDNQSSGMNSMLSEATYLLYENFDHLQPGNGLLACGQYISDESVGDILASGEIRMNSYAELTTYLEPGTYTLLAVPRESLTPQDWSNFSNGQDQFLFTEIWTPLPTASDSALAATGTRSSAWMIGLVAFMIVGGALLLTFRREES